MTTQEYYSAIDRAYSELSPNNLELCLLELKTAAIAEYGEKSSFSGAMCSELGSFYRGQGRYSESEAEFSRALEILETAVGKVSPDYATAMNNLAGTHRLQREFDKALSEFTEALEIYRNTVGETHILCASALNNLSLLCIDMNDLDSAADYLSGSSEILVRLPEHTDELASSLCNLAALDFRRSKYGSTIEHTMQAIALFENTVGTDTPHYHSALTTLGLCRLCLDDFSGALEALYNAANAAKNLYGENHHEYKRITQYISLTEERRKAND